MIHEVEADEQWHQAGIALATANLASKTTLLGQQSAATKASMKTFGFNAGIQLDISATETENQQHVESSRGSSLSGNNITIRTGNGNDITQTSTY